MYVCMIVLVGKWTRDGIENKTYEDWVSTFSATTVESRNRPFFGIQEFAHTLLLAEPILQEGLEKGVFGPAIQTLCDLIAKNKNGVTAGLPFKN